MGRPRKRKRKRYWTKLRLLNLISNAQFDLFGDSINPPSAGKMKLWIKDYLKRETLPEIKKVFRKKIIN